MVTSSSTSRLKSEKHTRHPFVPHHNPQRSQERHRGFGASVVSQSHLRAVLYGYYVIRVCGLQGARIHLLSYFSHSNPTKTIEFEATQSHPSSAKSPGGEIPRLTHTHTAHNSLSSKTSLNQRNFFVWLHKDQKERKRKKKTRARPKLFFPSLLRNDQGLQLVWSQTFAADGGFRYWLSTSRQKHV